ncbi:hypothetical protein F5Y14DRAFT_308161 [Nemania sp. NC0429]|nr:hypothetical protein F5Y14DRAFT_308161 [Nemania sp. NC0429]
MKPSRIGGSFKTSNTYSNLPVSVSQYRASPAKPPLVAKARAPARVAPSQNAENIPPRIPIGNITVSKRSPPTCPTPSLVPKPLAPQKVKTRPALTKLRTLNVFSNFTASLSRTSISQFTSSDSRRTSIASKSTARNGPTPYTNSQSASSSSSQVLPNSAADTSDPRLIHTAQSSSYWSGRFMALQDRFQSEALMPENLAIVVNAHAERPLLPVAQPSMTSSATMGCIPAAVKPDRSTRAATRSTTPPRYQRPRQQQVRGAEAAPKPLNTTGAAARRQSSNEVKAALLDEDTRCRRVFSHLDGLCTTNEARTSLRQWQQTYARRMDKESLLPEGGTMESSKAKESTGMSYCRSRKFLDVPVCGRSIGDQRVSFSFFMRMAQKQGGSRRSPGAKRLFT